MSAAAAEQLAYDEARRALDHQDATAAELRGGASLVIATAAIAISMLQPAGDGSVFGWLAVAAFLVVCIMSLTVIWPRDQTAPAVEIDALVRNLTSDGSCDETVTRSALITTMASCHRLNAERRRRVSHAFRSGGLALVVQLLATVAARIAAG